MEQQESKQKVVQELTDKYNKNKLQNQQVSGDIKSQLEVNKK